MDQLTAFERALLKQFETLANASATSLEASEITSKKLQELSSSFRSKLAEISKRQAELENSQSRLITALNAQTKVAEQWRDVAERLVTQVNALVNERRR